MIDQVVAIFECPKLERGELLVYHSMRVVVQVGFVGLAAAIIIALHAIEAQAERGGDDLSKVKVDAARIFDRSSHADHFVRILCTQGWVKRP